MKAFILDVDGVLTDGQMYYTVEGKIMKAFGADDHEALGDIKDKIHIEFVTGDDRGFDISNKRVTDMGFKLTLIAGIKNRTNWIDGNWGLKNTIYMGDSFMDESLLAKVGYSICPHDAYKDLRRVVNYVCRHSGGHRAVAEACLHIKEKFEL